MRAVVNTEYGGPDVLRTDGTTQARPAEVFAAEKQPRLLPALTEVYDLLINAICEGTATIARWPAVWSARSAVVGRVCR